MDFRARLGGHFFKLSLMAEGGQQLDSQILSGAMDAGAPATMGDVTTAMASEFAAVTGAFGTTIRMMHGLYIDLAKENRQMAKTLTESPIAAAQVELLKVQLEWKREEMEHDGDVARIEQMGGILETYAPLLFAHFTGKAAPGAAPSTGETVQSDWGRVVVDLGPKLEGFDADIWALIEAARDAEGDAECRACLDALKVHMRDLSPDRQTALFEALGPDGFKRIGDFMQKWKL